MKENLKEFPLIASASGSIVVMFENTDEDGILYISEWHCGDNHGEKKRFYKCKMIWNVADLDDAIYYFEDLCGSLKLIASKWDEISEKSAERVLFTCYQKVWDKYVRDFGSSDIGENYAEAKNRVGDNFAACELVTYAKRFCELIAEGAPRNSIINEAELLAQAMVIHNYCKNLEEVDNMG